MCTRFPAAAPAETPASAGPVPACGIAASTNGNAAATFVIPSRMLPAHFSCVVRAKSKLLSSRPSMTRREWGRTVDEGRNRKLMLLSSPGIALLCRTTRKPRFAGTVYAADSWYWEVLW